VSARAGTAAVDRTLAALADPVRRRSVELLAERPHRAGELAAAVGVSPPVMSRHLRVLRDAELVDEEHPQFDARVRIISLRPRPIDALKAWLSVAETGWSEQLAAFKAHVERA
jgi:DNA-binding transcriptional ArsR family regulator